MEDLSHVFHFRLEIDGIDELACQRVQLPEIQVNVNEVGAGANLPNKKHPGKVSISEMTIAKFVALNNPETWGYDWIRRTINELGQEYRGNAFLKLIDAKGTVTRTYDLGRIFVTQISTDELDRAGDAILFETITFAVERFDVV